MMLPAEQRLWVVECKPVTCVRAGEMVESYMSVSRMDLEKTGTGVHLLREGWS